MEHLLSKRITNQRSSRIRELLRVTEQPGMLSMAGGLPAPATFPTELLAAAFARATTRQGPTGPVAWQYGPTEGTARLRQQVAAEHAMPLEQVLVTTGSQQSLDLLARVLCDDGDVIAVEHPTYLGALQAFHLAGATVIGVPGDECGLDTAALEAELRRGLRPKAVYVVVNFHNPTGTTLSADRRRHLVQLADRYDFLVIEDDPYGALRFAGVAPASMGGPAAPVVRLGTASKVLAPGLRVGWMSGPQPVIAAAVRAKQAVDLHTSSVAQLIVAEARAEVAAFGAHLDAARAHYAAQAASLADAVQRHLPGATFARADGGMFLWVDLGVPTEPLLAAAVDRGVAFVPGEAFSAPGADPATVATRARLSFATLTPCELDEATSRLAAAIAAGG
jgi:2-aminoadipate transaminase